MHHAYVRAICIYDLYVRMYICVCKYVHLSGFDSRTLLEHSRWKGGGAILLLLCPCMCIIITRIYSSARAWGPWPGILSRKLLATRQTDRTDGRTEGQTDRLNKAVHITSLRFLRRTCENEKPINHRIACGIYSKSFAHKRSQYATPTNTRLKMYTKADQRHTLSTWHTLSPNLQ